MSEEIYKFDTAEQGLEHLKRFGYEANSTFGNSEKMDLE